MRRRCHPPPPPPPPCSFKYPGRDDFGMKNMNIGIDMGSRVAIVGPNGAGALPARAGPCWPLLLALATGLAAVVSGGLVGVKGQPACPAWPGIGPASPCLPGHPLTHPPQASPRS